MPKVYKQRPTKRRLRYAAQLRTSLEKQDPARVLRVAEALGLLAEGPTLASPRYSFSLIGRIVAIRTMGPRVRLPA